MVFKKFYILTVILFNEFNVYNKKDQEKLLQMMKLVWKMSLLPKQKGLLNFLAFFITQAY